jgi:hypothetical protein
MKIAVSKPHARASARNVHAVKQPMPQEHDLPILALQEAPTLHLDWDALMHDGVQPALLVGGERRSHGRR